MKTSSTRALRQELTDVVARLNDEPLTHLMLGHRELFHSNLLAWFFKCNPAAADRVFGSLTTEGNAQGKIRREVQREKNNLDLWFRWPNRHPLVIENKVFSLPDEKQLENYTTKATKGGQPCALWLLSLSDPNWPDGRRVIGGSEWRWLSYRELAELIRSSLPSDDRSYATETMRHYAGVIDLLSDLVPTVVVTDRNEMVALADDVQAALGDDRLASNMAKLRSQSVTQRVRQALKAAGIENTAVESEFTRGAPLISGFRAIERAPGARSGWQFQGNQFRLAIITPHLAGRAKAEREARNEFARANEDLFEFGHLDEILGTGGSATQPLRSSGNPVGFNRFDPDFVYRYKRTPNLSVAQLEAAAVAVGRRATSHSPQPH